MSLCVLQLFPRFSKCGFSDAASGDSFPLVDIPSIVKSLKGVKYRLYFKRNQLCNQIWKFPISHATPERTMGRTQWRQAQLPGFVVVGADARRAQDTASVEDKHPKEVWA